jgi:hypothetical protein
MDDITPRKTSLQEEREKTKELPSGFQGKLVP